MRFKIEDSYKKKYTSFNMQKLTVLDKIDFDNKTWSGYEMKECDFPTIDKSNPCKLNEDEEEVIKKLIHSFVTSSKLSLILNFC